MMVLKADLIKKFEETQSFNYDPIKKFRLSSGILSPYYVDCKKLMAYPGPRHMVAQLAFELIKDLALDSIGGLEIGAIAIANTISDYGYGATPRQEWRTFVVRKRPKEHGLGKLIEGAVKPGDRVLIVDDVLTSGESLITAVDAARETGMKVDHALVIVDRAEQNGRANVEKRDVTLLSLLTIEDLTSLRNPEVAIR